MDSTEYGKYLVRKPIREGDRNGRGFTNPALSYLSNDLVPGCNVFLDFRWYTSIPQPNPLIPEHVHDYPEIILHIGSDPHNPEYLGGEIEVQVGGERLAFDQTTALYVPKGTKHGPFTWKKFERPHLQMAIVLGGGTIEASKPGGRNKG